MSQGQFEAAAYEVLDAASDVSTNARYAPIGNEAVGLPFLAYKQPGYYMTDWTPAGQRSSNIKREMNLPTDNTTFRNTLQDDGVKLQNNQNEAWVGRFQTLANNGDTIACRNNTDCASWPGTTCNPQFMSWTDAKGNQGNYCSVTKYPELQNGYYQRKNALDNGIGRACKTDSDCAGGYHCNNETDKFGKNIQQTGFCAQKYSCPGGTTHFLGYPYNSGIPMPPPDSQNNEGLGYSSESECKNSKMAQQDCKPLNGRWFATYPGYCPVVTSLRENGNPRGALVSESRRTVDGGIKIPAFANIGASSIGKPDKTFQSWNMNAKVNVAREMNEPLEYELSINPK
jgi:hypothetical protein